MPDDNDAGTAHIDMTPTAVGHVAAIRSLLSAMLLEQRADLLQLAFGPFQRQELVLVDDPIPQAKRLLVPRPGQGGVIPIASSLITTVLEENEGRLGGLIVNSGTVPVRLVFCRPGEAGGAGNAPSSQAANRPCTYLTIGGSFDFRQGNALYGGPVQAYGVGGAGQLDVSEF